MIQRIHCIALLLICICELAGCTFNSHHTASRSDSLAADHQPSSSLLVETRNGSVEVIGDTSQQDVQILAKLRCAAESKEIAQQRLDETRIDISRMQAGQLQIKPIFPEPQHSNDSASFEIRVPDAEGVTIKTSNGRVSISDLAGALTINTSNGSITVAHHQGDAQVTTSNGSIDVTQLQGALQARTSNGSIVAKEIAGEVRAASSNGSVTISLTPEQQGPLHAQTSNGSIRAEVGPLFEGEVKMNTSNGSVTVDVNSIPVRSLEVDRNHGRVALGQSTHESILTTSNGRINFKVVQ